MRSWQRNSALGDFGSSCTFFYGGLDSLESPILPPYIAHRHDVGCRRAGAGGGDAVAPSHRRTLSNARLTAIAT